MGNGFAQIIDNYMTYAQSAIDNFSDPGKLPQIAISVDMLDTGIDVPEVLNLVFFKKVMSKAKFWQMIGRGTRLCPGLLNGADKNQFYIFDFCGNFAFFRMSQGKPVHAQLSLQGALFRLKGEIVYKLQDMAYQTEELVPFRQALVKELLGKVQELNRDNFAVKQHLRAVERFSKEETYQGLVYGDIREMEEELCPLILPDADDPKALRFDALLYGIELAYMVGKTSTKARRDLVRQAEAVASVGNIPEIQEQKELLDRILHTDYLERAGLNEFEHIRKSLRDLMKYVLPSGHSYSTNFDDQILETEWHESQLETDDLKNYRAKAEFYVREHQDSPAIAKLKSNLPLTQQDVAELESILWSQVGTQEDYEAEYGEKPLGEFVREVVGMDMKAAKEAFSVYLNDVNLDDRQIYFVNQIVEYIVQNGLMKDLSVLQKPPFTDLGSISQVFDAGNWKKIREIIQKINANARVA